MQGTDYVIATGRPVLYMGGFMRQDAVLITDQLAQMVAEGKLRFIYLDAQGGFRGGFGTATQNFGAPDGTGIGSTNTPSPGRAGMQVSLYDCGG